MEGRGSPLTVEVLCRLAPQGRQAHLRVGPLQHQPPAVQVGAVTQGIEGSLERDTACEWRPPRSLAACPTQLKASPGPGTPAPWRGCEEALRAPLPLGDYVTRAELQLVGWSQQPLSRPVIGAWARRPAPLQGHSPSGDGEPVSRLAFPPLEEAELVWPLDDKNTGPLLTLGGRYVLCRPWGFRPPALCCPLQNHAQGYQHPPGSSPLLLSTLPDPPLHAAYFALFDFCFVTALLRYNSSPIYNATAFRLFTVM